MPTIPTLLYGPVNILSIPTIVFLSASPENVRMIDTCLLAFIPRYNAHYIHICAKHGSVNIAFLL